MHYEVRYQIGGEDQSTEIEAESAAQAATIVQERFIESDEVFELIQVTLLDEMPTHDFAAESEA